MPPNGCAAGRTWCRRVRRCWTWPAVAAGTCNGSPGAATRYWVDRSAEALQSAAAHGEVLACDLESDPWPLQGREFGAVVVTNYLWRALLPRLVECVAPGGVLLYETFAQGNETVGRPANPDFLLAPGELLRACEGLRVVAYEEGYLEPPARFVQRIAALRLPGGAAAKPRLRAEDGAR